MSGGTSEYPTTRSRMPGCFAHYMLLYSRAAVELSQRREPRQARGGSQMEVITCPRSPGNSSRCASRVRISAFPRGQLLHR